MAEQLIPAEEIEYACRVLGLAGKSAFEASVPAILSGFGFTLWNGIVALTRHSLVLSSAPGFLSSGRAMSVPFPQVIAFSRQDDAGRISFLEAGAVRHVDVSGLVGDGFDEWCRFSLLLKLRLLKCPTEGVPWSDDLDFPVAKEVAGRVLADLEMQSRSFQESSPVLLWRAFLLLHLGRLDPAMALLEHPNLALATIRFRLLAQIALTAKQPAEAKFLLRFLPITAKFRAELERLCCLLGHEPEKTIGLLPPACRRAGRDLWHLFAGATDLVFPDWVSLQDVLCSPRIELINFWAMLIAGNTAAAEEAWKKCAADPALAVAVRVRCEAALAWVNQDASRAFFLLRSLFKEQPWGGLLMRIAWKAGLEAELPLSVSQLPLDVPDEFLAGLAILAEADARARFRAKDDGIPNNPTAADCVAAAKMPLEIEAGGTKEPFPLPDSSSSSGTLPEWKAEKPLSPSAAVWVGLHRARILACRKEWEAFSREMVQVEAGLVRASDDLPLFWRPDDLRERQAQKAHFELLSAECAVVHHQFGAALARLAPAEHFFHAYGLERDGARIEAVRQWAHRGLATSPSRDSLLPEPLILLGNGRGVESLRGLVNFLLEKLHFWNDVPSCRDSLDELMRLSEEPLVLAVVGEFNAGKSTLLNAWLGKELLPTGVRPTTAVPCIVRYGEKDGGKIIYTDGSSESVLPENLRRYVDERARSANDVDNSARKAVSVELFLPIPDLKTVWLVDTPGLNSLVPEHRAATAQLLKRADAFIWVVDATQLGRESEAVSCRELVPPGATMVAVLNRMDEIAADERDEVVAAAAGFFRVAPDSVFAISARAVLSGTLSNPLSANKGFQEAFARFTTFLRERVFEESFILKTASLEDKTRGVLRTLQDIGLKRRRDGEARIAAIREHEQRCLTTIESGFSVDWMERFRLVGVRTTGRWEQMVLARGGFSRAVLAAGCEAVILEPLKIFLEDLWAWLDSCLVEFLRLACDLSRFDRYSSGFSAVEVQVARRDWQEFLCDEIPQEFAGALLRLHDERDGRPLSASDVRTLFERFSRSWRALGPEIGEWLRLVSFCARDALGKVLARDAAEIMQPAERLIACLEEN
jgi:GTPase Era involved in 16S rRNA processing